MAAWVTESWDPTLTARIEPIVTNEDILAVAAFMRDNDSEGLYRGSLTLQDWVGSVAPQRMMDAPNHGYMLIDDDRVAGAYIALYSERIIDGRVERFCNLSTWNVLPTHRTQSVGLLKAILDQPGYSFTDLTPARKVATLNRRLGFQTLDTTAALIPNLPWPTLPGRIRVSSSPAILRRFLDDRDRKVYEDHATAADSGHVLIRSDSDVCYVLLKFIAVRRLPAVEILHASNPELFRTATRHLTRHLLIRYRKLVTKVELRVAHGHPSAPHLTREYLNMPRMYRSSTLDSAHVDYLYTDLAWL